MRESCRACSSTRLQPTLELLNPGREIKNELNTRHPPRVINRLRLGAIHTPKYSSEKYAILVMETDD